MTCFFWLSYDRFFVTFFKRNGCQLKILQLILNTSPFFHLNPKNVNSNIFNITDKCVTTISEKMFYTLILLQKVVQFYNFEDNWTIWKITSSFFSDAICVKIKWKNIIHFSKQSNHMMLRSVIHTFVEYRRLRIFYLVIKENYQSVERCHKKRISRSYSKQQTNGN